MSCVCEEFREPSAAESRLLERILGSADCPGSRELTVQCAQLLVSSIDNDGGLRLKAHAGHPARVVRRIPVEADYDDRDGMRMRVHVLVHVVDGWLDELEVFREDGKRVIVPATSVVGVTILAM